jgi:hypothetical protein
MVGFQESTFFPQKADCEQNAVNRIGRWPPFSLCFYCFHNLCDLVSLARAHGSHSLLPLHKSSSLPVQVFESWRTLWTVPRTSASWGHEFFSVLFSTGSPVWRTMVPCRHILSVSQLYHKVLPCPVLRATLRGIFLPSLPFLQIRKLSLSRLG